MSRFDRHQAQEVGGLSSRRALELSLQVPRIIAGHRGFIQVIRRCDGHGARPSKTFQTSVSIRHTSCRTRRGIRHQLLSSTTTSTVQQPTSIKSLLCYFLLQVELFTRSVWYFHLRPAFVIKDAIPISTGVYCKTERSCMMARKFIGFPCNQTFIWRPNS